MNPDIYHYGVKGMKWGVRKQRPSSSSGTKKKQRTNLDLIREKLKGKASSNTRVRKTTSETNQPAKTSTKKKSVSEMSDDDLRKVINRMQMERTYAQLTAKEVSKGRKFVTEVLYNSAKSTATTYATKAMTKGIEELLKKSAGKKS